LGDDDVGGVGGVGGGVGSVVGGVVVDVVGGTDGGCCVTGACVWTRFGA
jgi:hypothetical protein